MVEVSCLKYRFIKGISAPQLDKAPENRMTLLGLPVRGFAAPGCGSCDLEQETEGVSAKKWPIEIVKHSVRHPLNRLHGPTVRHDAPRDKHDLEVWPILGPVGKLGVDPGEALHPAQGGERSGSIGNVLQHAWDVKEPLLPNADLNQQIRKW